MAGAVRRREADERSRDLAAAAAIVVEKMGVFRSASGLEWGVSRRSGLKMGLMGCSDRPSIIIVSRAHARPDRALILSRWFHLHPESQAKPSQKKKSASSLCLLFCSPSFPSAARAARVWKRAVSGARP